MSIKKINLHQITIPLVHPFQTSFGTQSMKHGILVQLIDDVGNEGWSEIPLSPDPDYCYETIQTAWHILKDYLIPSVLKISTKTIPEYSEFISTFRQVRGHQFAKAGLEIAYWVLKAEQENKFLGSFFGANKRLIPTGVSIGIQPTIEGLIKRISHFLDQKYQRIKIKIAPDWDVNTVSIIRKELGNEFLLMVDANSAYSLDDINHLKKLDDYNLLMIEQPLAYRFIRTMMLRRH
jgi:O-succinylbenzoate synthase